MQELIEGLDLKDYSYYTREKYKMNYFKNYKQGMTKFQNMLGFEDSQLRDHGADSSQDSDSEEEEKGEEIDKKSSSSDE